MHRDRARDSCWALVKELVLNKTCNFLLSFFLGFQTFNNLIVNYGFGFGALMNF